MALPGDPDNDLDAPNNHHMYKATRGPDGDELLSPSGTKWFYSIYTVYKLYTLSTLFSQSTGEPVVPQLEYYST